ncbi:U4/U6.U5 tri-snRNP-associated protein like [Actinidia chinensis var. chinensis]|uniref:U4/U6.U5 tri-snRNP-associated protein like n=1 Tax=Actinidia chinensis var. chinensis TaxID=1590841 RepID=A0A2R6R537_ACTCC|nr:U4/U6.U5 tri-snRNP-associated protein like [Actinidia chinensis var. chinensis]
MLAVQLLPPRALRQRQPLHKAPFTPYPPSHPPPFSHLLRRCLPLQCLRLHRHGLFLLLRALSVNHKSHPHELDLTDITPDKDSLPDNCKLCNKLLDSKYWNYQCLKCVNFRVHTFCATNEVKPGLYLDDEDDSDGSNLNPTGPPQSEDDKAEIVLSEDAVVELIKVGIQMQMAEQLAEMFASGKIN